MAGRLAAERGDIAAGLIEATGVVLFYAAFVHLLTAGSAGLAGIVVSAGMLGVIGFVICAGPAKDWTARRSLWALLSALGGGFWIFSLLRYFGLVRWPLAHPLDLADYGELLYCHFILSITVLTPVLLLGYVSGVLKMVTWGNWPPRGKGVLLLTAAGCWVWALYTLVSTDVSASGNVTGFIVVCLAKALLTGATEEICYRGIIQPAAIRRFGIPLGIVLQGCLYAAFHVHLGPALVPQAAFLVGVMALGLVFGTATRVTSGIGWAVTVHVAIDVVIEWRNLS